MNLTRTTILFFGVFTTLGILNLDKTVASLLAGAGVIGLAIGFAFQEIMFTKAVTNYTRTPERRVEIDVGISYGENLRQVEKVARAAVAQIPGRISDRDTDFYYYSFGDSSINFHLRFWIEYRQQRDYSLAVHLAIVAVKEAFDQNKITIPFPIRTLDFGIKGGLPLNPSLLKLEKASTTDREAE